MRNLSILLLVFLLVGCSYGSQRIKSLISDPHYAQYKEKINDLESSYLDGEISYPEYLEKKRQLDEDYTKEVQDREAIIHSQ